MTAECDFRYVFWIVKYLNERFSSNVASIRYMSMIPARTLGGNVVVFNERSEPPNVFLDRYRPKVLIFNKAFEGSYVRLAREARKRGVKVFSTYCDWHFDKGFNRLLSNESDRLVVQTKAMANAVVEHFNKTAIIIEEPFEGKRNAPKFSPDGNLRLLWFGSGNNFDGLSVGCAQLSGASVPKLILEVVTDDVDGAREIVEEAFADSDGLHARYIEWSPDTQDQALERADIVIIPSLLTKEKLVKGHNRLVESIQAGRIALAHPLPQYRELADYCWCGDNLASGIEWVLANPAEAVARLEKGQAYIDGRFSPEAVSRRWRSEIVAVL